MKAVLGSWMLALCLVLSACSTVPATQPAPALGEAFKGWSLRELPGKRPTLYGTAQRDGRSCLLAQADNSASLLRRHLALQPAAVGEVSFDWWIERVDPKSTVADGDTDDAAARLVLGFDGDEARLSMRNRMLFELARTLMGEAPPYATLVYVWDAKAPEGSVHVNERSDRIREIVVGSGVKPTAAWLRFHRNVVEDFKLAFGEEPGALIGAGFMTDADNSKGSARACYGDLLFLDAASKKPLPGSLMR